MEDASPEISGVNPRHSRFSSGSSHGKHGCFPRKPSCFPRKSGCFPRKSGHFPGKPGHFPRKSSHFPRKPGHFPRKSDHFPRKPGSGHNPGLALSEQGVGQRNLSRNPRNSTPQEFFSIPQKSLMNIWKNLELEIPDFPLPTHSRNEFFPEFAGKKPIFPSRRRFPRSFHPAGICRFPHFPIP